MKQSTFSAVMANSIKNLLQGYTKGIRFTAILTLLFTLGVGSMWGADTWTLVKNVSDLAVGDEVVIAASGSAYALGTTQNTNNRNAVSITKSGDNITIGNTVQVLTLKSGTTSGTFAFYTGSGYLYAASSSKNYLKTQTTNNANGSWSITITNTGVATIKAQGTNTRNLLKKNSSSALFACYSSGQSDVVIYKKQASCSYNINYTTNNKADGAGGTWSEGNCFEQVGSTTEWRYEMTLPGAGGSFWVGNGAWVNSKSEVQSLSTITFVGLQGTSCGSKPYPGEGAVGYVRIYSDSGSKNYYAAFQPTYQIAFGIEGQTWTHKPFTLVSGSQYETELLDIPVDFSNSYKYYVGPKKSDNTTIWVDGKSSTVAMNTMGGMSDVNAVKGSKGIFRIYDNSCDNNWYCSFIPYYNYKLLKDDGSVFYTSAYVSSEAANKATTIYSTEPTKTGHTFVGWSRTQNATTADVKAGDSYTYWKANDTFYPVWKKDTYTITSTLTNCSSDPEIPSSYTYTGSAANLTYIITPSADYALPDAVTVSGTTYTWDKTTGKLTLTGTISSNVTITITAKKVYTITWKVNKQNYTTGTPTTTVYEGSTYQNLTLPTPPADGTLDACYTGKRFVGWSTTNIGSVESTAPSILFKTAAEAPNTTITENKTLYAVFATETTTGSGSAGWSAVSSVNDLKAGDIYAISSADTKGTYLSTYAGGNNYPSSTTTICKLELGGSSGAWTFKIADGSSYDNYYLTATSTTSSNHLKAVSTADNYCKFTISFSSNEAVITCTGKSSRNILRYNSTNSPSIFSCYSSGQSAVYLQKYSAGTTTETSGYVTECCTLNNITLDGSGTVTGGTFSATAEKACKGEDITLTATPENNCYEFVSWTIKKTSDGSDVTTSVLSGNTLTMPDYAVTVYATFKSLSVTEIALAMTGGHQNLDVGQTNQLLVTYTPADATCDKAIVSWTSSDDNVMSVSNTGLVTAERAGNATITAKTEGGVTATYTITVNNPACVSWYLHYWNQTTGGDECFYKVKPDDASDHEWRTNNFSLPSNSDEDKFIVNNTPEDQYKTDQIFRTGIGFADIQRGGQNCGTNPYPGQDALGQLSIYDDSNTPNRYIAFYPAQYLVTYGKEGAASWDVLPFKNTTGYEYETEPFMVPNGYKTDDTYKYYVGIINHHGNIMHVADKSSTDAMNTVSGLFANDMAGKWGTWHIYSNSCDANWYCEFISYYRVDFDLNGGEGDFAPRYGKATEPYVKFTTTDIGAPTRDGYKFLGWKDQNNKIYAPTGATVTINNDYTLTALWIEEYPSNNCRWEEVTIDDIEYGDEVVVTMTKSGYTYALNSSNGTTTYPKADQVTVENKTITSNVANEIIWNISGNATDGYVLYPNGSTSTWLYCTKSSNTVKVGTGTDKVFTIQNGYLYHINTTDSWAGYVGVSFNTTPYSWRHYPNTTGVIEGQTLKFYKKVCLDPTRYWVTWDAGEGSWFDGSTKKEEIYTVGTNISAPAENPTRDGYEFAGWNPNLTTMPAENTTFTAKWTKEYTITWKVGSTTVLTETVTGGIDKIPADPQNDAIGDCADTFMGWSEKSAGSTPQDEDYYSDLCTAADMKAKHTSVTEDKTFYAVFATATTTPGTSTTTNKTYSHTIESKTWEATGTQTLNGVSWTLANNGNYYAYDTTKGQQVGSGNKPATSMTLTTSGFASASKITSVTINTSGASSTNAKVSVKVGGTSYSCNSNTSPSITTTATAYEFTGNSTGEVVISWSQTSSKAIYFKSITVVYSNTTTTPDVTTYSNYVTNCCALAPATNLTVSGTTSNTATLTWTAPSPTTGITKLQVRNADNDAVVVDDVAVGTTTATIIGLTECTSYKYYVASVGDCEVFSNTVTAQPFSNAKTVNYDYNGGSGSVTSFTTSCENQVITLPTATRAGYDFNGWYTAATGGTKVGDAGDTYNPTTSPITLYAQWTKQIYIISFHANGGTGTMANQSADENNVIAQLTANQFERTGYAFVGWNTKANGTGTAYADQASNITLTGNLTLYAQWAAIVTLNDAGTETTTHPATAGGTITLPDGANACDPYEFVGWTTVATGDWNEGINEPALVATTYTPSAPTTLYAVYKIQSKGNSNAFKLSFEGSNGNTYYVDEYSSSPLRGYSNITKDDAVTFIKTKMYPNDDTRYYLYMEEKGEYLYYNGYFNTTRNTPSESQGWIIHTVGDKIKLQSTYSYDPKYLYFSDRDNYAINIDVNASGSEFNMLSAVTSTYVASPLCNQEITVTFETGNGDFVDNAPATNPLTVTMGETITLPTCEYPGYEFMGWLKDEQQLDPSDILATYYTGDYTVDGISSTITFYAYYKVVPEEVEFTGKDDAQLLMYYYDGSENYYYAASRTEGNGEMQSMQNCFNATTWTFTNIGNMQYYIQDEAGKYLGVVSDNDNNFSWSNTPKVWNFTLVNGLWKMVCEDSPSRALMYISTGKTFANSAISNETNGAYSYVTLGICPYPTYTTNPVLSQGFSITNTAMVTSAVDQKVKAANALTLETRNIELPCTFTISAPNITFYDNTGTEVTQLTASAASEQFELYFAYKPTAENTMEYPTITIVDDEMKTYTIKNRIYARSLPNTFAVVAKVGGMWYALPSQGLNSTDALVGYPVEVDNLADPTAVTAVPTNADWSLRQVYASTRDLDRFKTGGHNLVFVNNVSPEKALNPSSSSNYLLTNAQYNNYHNATTPGLYEWTPTTTDLETYQLTNVYRTTKQLNIATNTVFGVHASEVVTADVRFLPIQDRYTPLAAQVVEWKENSVVVMYNGDPAQTASVSVNGGSAQTTTLSSAQKDIAVYELAANGLATNPTQQLSITIGTEKAILPIPYIISGTQNDIDLLAGSTVVARQEVAKVADLVVLKDAKLTAAGAKGNPYKFRNVTIYGGGKLVIPSDKGFGVASLTLRAGGITDAGEYDYVYPQFELRGTFTNTAGKFYYDYITDYDHWYHLVLPFAGELGSITYPTEFYGTNVTADNTGSWVIKRYAGEIRATGNYKAWVDIETDNPKPTATTPGVGYIFWGAPKKVSVNGGASTRQKWGIQRITMSVTAPDAMTAENGDKAIQELSSYANVDGNSEKDNDQGWNLIGNSYMVNLTGLNSQSLQIGQLIHELDASGNWTGKWHWDDTSEQTGLRYVTIPSDHFDTYTAQLVSAFSAANPMVAGRAFFVQIAEESVDLMFTAANRASLMPQHLAAQNTAVEVETGIVLSSETMQDEVNFWIKDGKTNDYEYNADYPKTPNNTNFNIYGVHINGNLSWVAISPEIAEESMPIGYQVPAAGTYTLSISETYYSDLLDALYVTDHALSPEVTVDLMDAPYEFSVNQAETNNERFTVSLKLKSENQGPTTGLENIGVNSDKPIKFIYQDKMYIYNNGIIYDATGKQINTINNK